MTTEELNDFQKIVDETQKLWKPIFEEERNAIINQPELSEKEWKEFRISHAVNI